MAGVTNLLRYKMLAYWRHAFSVRGKYDAGSGIILLIIAGFAYRYVSILKGAANSMANGGADELGLLFGIVFLSWILPALESQSISAQTGKFLHLPFTKTQFAFIDLAAFFLLPTSLISLLVSLAAIFPFLYSKDPASGIAALLTLVLFSAFANIAFINLMRRKLFRRVIFLSSIFFAFVYFNGKFDVLSGGRFLPIQTFVQDAFFKNSLGQIALFGMGFLASGIVAFVSVRQSISSTDRSGNKLNSRFISRLKLPLKFGELIKKDFISSWRLLDSWIAVMTAIFYAILLTSGDLSFESFAIAISVIVMMNGSLAFNVFGSENASGIDRLSLFPIKSEDLLTAKNKAFALVVFSQIFFLFPLIFFRFGTILLLISILKTVSVILLYTAWGNGLSIKFPFQMSAYQISFGGSIASMLYGIVVISAAIIAPEFFTIGQTATKLIVNILMVISCVLIYRFSLRRNSQMLPANWRNIALKLS